MSGVRWREYWIKMEETLSRLQGEYGGKVACSSWWCWRYDAGLTELHREQKFIHPGKQKLNTPHYMQNNRHPSISRKHKEVATVFSCLLHLSWGKSLIWTQEVSLVPRCHSKKPLPAMVSWSHQNHTLWDMGQLSITVRQVTVVGNRGSQVSGGKG